MRPKPEPMLPIVIEVKPPRDLECLRAPVFLTISAGVYCAIARDLKRPAAAGTASGR